MSKKDSGSANKAPSKENDTQNDTQAGLAKGNVETKAQQDNIHRFDETLLKILVCPISKSALKLSDDKSELISNKACLAYPIRDGIPVLLVEEARQFSDAEMAKVKAKFK